MAGQSGSQVGSRNINRAILGSIQLPTIRFYVASAVAWLPVATYGHTSAT
jgi:hypothetical protein